MSVSCHLSAYPRIHWASLPRILPIVILWLQAAWWIHWGLSAVNFWKERWSVFTKTRQEEIPSFIGGGFPQIIPTWLLRPKPITKPTTFFACPAFELTSAHTQRFDQTWLGAGTCFKFVSCFKHSNLCLAKKNLGRGFLYWETPSGHCELRSQKATDYFVRSFLIYSA